MKRIGYILLIICCLSGCKTQDIKPEQVIHDLVIVDRTPLADGTTVIDLSTQLDANADADKRVVIFRASSGAFLPANDTVISITASFENKLLVARTKYKVPASPGTVKFIVQPQVRSATQDFILTDQITVSPSIPASLVLTPSALNVKTNFASEISLSALLKNSFKSNVSSGCKVLFQDYYAGGAPVNGRFRALRDMTDNTSTATVSYSPGPVTAGTSIYVKCTYIGDNGQPTSVADSVLIYVTPPN